MKKFTVLVLVFIIALNVCFCQTPHERYNQLKNSIEERNIEFALNYLQSLDGESIFEVLELSITTNDTAVIYFVGSQIINRLKNQESHDILINILRRDSSDINHDYLSVLFQLLNKTYRSFDSKSLIVSYDILKNYFSRKDFSNYYDSKASNLRLLILQTNNLILSFLHNNGLIDKEKVDEHFKFLQSILINERENTEVRVEAIKGIRYLNYEDATNSLIQIIKNDAYLINHVLMQPVCIALSSIDKSESFEYINNILLNTDNEYVFASAAIS